MIELRKLEVADYPQLREIYMNPSVAYPAALGAVESEAMMMRLAAALISTNNVGIVAQGQLVGVIGHSVGDQWSTGEQAATIGYVVHEDFWGRGYATQAVRIYSQMLLESGLPAIYADCFLDNPASARVLEKAGFVYQYDFTRKFDCFAQPRQLHLYKKTPAAQEER